MRVISGKARGIKLDAPSGLKTRPTTDRVKENIFNLIQFYIPNARVLDLFAGSGAMGIEALSRGASLLVSVDQSVNCIEIIEKNLVRTKLIDNAIILNKKVENIPDWFAIHRNDGVFDTVGEKDIDDEDAKNIAFDVIFADPPYGRSLCDEVLNMVVASGMLSENGIVILEHAKDDVISFAATTMELYRQKVYGNTAVSIYRKV